jgi:hypothetical protein
MTNESNKTLSPDRNASALEIRLDEWSQSRRRFLQLGAAGAVAGLVGARSGSSIMGGATASGSSGAAGGGSTVTRSENMAKGCSVGSVPSMSNPMLPDPFKFFNGKRISKKEDWPCLRAELMAALQAGIYGPKMPKPDTLTATFSEGTLNINMTVGTNKKLLSVQVRNGGSTGSPKPCVIACGASSLPLSQFASINMVYNNISSEQNLSGLVKDLYGNECAKSGALIGWAWGCSRIIDGLELCPEAGIDLRRIAVTGCSRCGKGALAMGAFDERVALTLPQEGGSGGSALWRVSSKEKSLGANIQHCGQITGEARWQGSDFKGFCGDIASLPCDQHYAVALCAPRAILVIENDIDWLGPVATYGGGFAGQKVYEALGIKDRCGVSVAASHGHCQFPAVQQPYLDAYVNRFLKGNGTTTAVDDFHTSGNKSRLESFKPADWINWDVPTLSGNLPYDPFA